MVSFLDLLQSDGALWVGAVLALLLVVIRAATAERDLRQDLLGSVYLLGAFLLLRGLEWPLRGQLPRHINMLLHVGWMLTFSFALIRTAVSFSLWLVRLKGRPVPKILRDVIDFSLYLTVSIPVLKSELALDLSGLLATSAIASVVLGLALQETLGNLFAGLSIQIERPFQVGDYIEVKDLSGKVVQVAWRATRIRTARHEAVSVPNNVLSKEAVKNFSRAGQPVALELTFTASYDSPPNQVKAAVLDMLSRIACVLEQPPATVRTFAYLDSAIEYQIRFFIADWEQSGAARDEVYSRLWYRLRRERIDQPYPQVMLHTAAPRPSDEGPWSLRARVELLHRVDFLRVLDLPRLKELAEEMTLRQFGAGEHVIQEGATGHSVYIVADGEVVVQARNGYVEVTRLKVGQYFGEMSLLTGEPRSATVLALTDAVLFEVDRPTFARLFAENPGLARQLSAILAERRLQLKAVAAEAGGGAEAEGPEEKRILSRLRSIFGLKQE